MILFRKEKYELYYAYDKQLMKEKDIGFLVSAAQKKLSCAGDVERI